MGNYHSLQIFKYENQNSDINEEYSNRIENPTVIKTNLKINPENDGQRLGQQYPLFLLPINDVLKLEGIIEQNSRRIKKLTSSLPPIASKLDATSLNRCLRYVFGCWTLVSVNPLLIVVTK